MAGLRISEFCGLDAHHLDVAAGRLRVPRGATKTDAGERALPLLPALRERLTEHRMDYPVPPSSQAFPTRIPAGAGRRRRRADLLEDLIECSLEDAKSLLEGGSRRAHPGTIPERTSSTAAAAQEDLSSQTRKARKSGPL